MRGVGCKGAPNEAAAPCVTMNSRFAAESLAAALWATCSSRFAAASLVTSAASILPPSLLRCRIVRRTTSGSTSSLTSFPPCCCRSNLRCICANCSALADLARARVNSKAFSVSCNEHESVAIFARDAREIVPPALSPVTGVLTTPKGVATEVAGASAQVGAGALAWQSEGMICLRTTGGAHEYTPKGLAKTGGLTSLAEETLKLGMSWP
mmetsp:Transcript_21957/g.34902  ORF Transcript_21957/g.34902 Transcript_21957/m.34902 type:complete len:210 (-) Transcript_21957:61-690(-)